MKFGKFLSQESIPSWQDEYINYKKLKSLAKELGNLAPTNSGNDETSDNADATESETSQVHPLDESETGQSDYDTDDHVVASDVVLVQQQDNPTLDSPIPEWNVFKPQHGKSRLIRQTPAGIQTPAVLVNETQNLTNDGRREVLSIASLVPKTLPVEILEKELVFANTLDAELDKVRLFYAKQVKFFKSQLHVLRKGMQPKNSSKSRTPAIRTVFSRFGKSELRRRTTKSFSKESSEIDSTTEEVYRKPRGRKGKVLERTTVDLVNAWEQILGYLTINTVALHKALKKHDKLTPGWLTATSDVYPYIQSGELVPSTFEAESLKKETEDLYVTVFAKGSRKNGLLKLRKMRPKQSHAVTFAGGLLCGLALCFIGILAVQFGTSPFLASEPKIVNFYAVFRVYVTIPLLLLVWGVDMMLFHKLHINIDFIMNIGTHVSSFLLGNEVILVSSITLVISLAAMISHVALVLWFPTVANNKNILFTPVWTAAILFIVMFLLPFNVFHRRFRGYLVRLVGRVVCAPLYSVSFADSFVADQLTSVGVVFTDLVYSTCYLASQDTVPCAQGVSYARYLVIFLPYWWRFAQCVRKYSDDEKKSKHNLWNAGKYFAALLVTASSLSYGLAREHAKKVHGADADDKIDNDVRLYLGFWLGTAVFSTLYSYTWDIRMDWGLCEAQSPVRFLRRRLRFPPGVYYWAIGSNLMARFAWVVTISPAVEERYAYEIVRFAAALVEICRRGQWNLFRIIQEDEHYLEQKRIYHPIRISEIDSNDDDDNGSNSDSTTGNQLTLT